MLTTLLKQRMESLPGDQFTKTWQCIEVMQQALDGAGDAALLAMTYVRAAYEEQVARVVDEVDTPAHDRPHLAAGLYGSTGVAGPLVVPGVTGCLRCSHLHACDADPHWPAVSLQLASATRRLPLQPHDRLLARLVAVQAVLLLRQWADDSTALEQWADHAVEIRLPSGAHRRLPRLPHPLCGCRWADTDRAAS